MQMSKTLQLQDFKEGTNLSEIIRTLNENNANLKEAYARIWNDIRWPDWIYFTSQQKKWRLGPVGDHLEAQWFTGDNILNDWRNDALWAMQWRSYGGADA